MIKSNKAQGSIEIIIGIFFLIFFLYIFNLMAADTVKTVEINKIKEQEQEVVLSLSDFLYSGASIYADPKFNIIDYNMQYRVPEINIPSSRLSCIITIDTLRTTMITGYDDENIIYTVPNILPNTYETPIVTNCGNELSCVTQGNKLRCT